MRNITLSLGFALVLLANAGAQPLPLRIDFKDMLFPDKDLGDKFKRFHAAAEKMAGPRWDRLPYECRGEYRGRGTYYADWCSFRPDDLNGPLNYQGPNELNYVQLGAFYFRDKKDPDHLRKIIGFALYSRWKPAGSGWNAFVEYTTFNDKPDPATTSHNEHFHIRWHFHPTAQQKTWPAAVVLNLGGHAQYATHLTSGGTNYQIMVLSNEGVRKPRLPDAEVIRLLDSPEALRDQLLSDHEDLLKAARKSITAGRCIYSAHLARPVPPGKQPEPPMVSTRPLSESDKAEILKRAEFEIGNKIAAVKEHYKELHAAAAKAFPIRACLIKAKGEG